MADVPLLRLDDAGMAAPPAGDPASSACPPASLMRLPNELLCATGSLLDRQSMARLMATSRFFYRLLVDRLHQQDQHAHGPGWQRADGCLCCSPAFRWGCRTSNVDTLRRSVAAGARPARSWPHALAMALDSGAPDPAATLAFLLDHGMPANVVSLAGPPTAQGDGATFWPILEAILDAAARPPRRCPVPAVACFIAHGARARLPPGDAAPSSPSQASLTAAASAVWDRVQCLVQVRGPRQWRWPHAPGRLVLRRDHCLHDGVPCNVALTRLLLQQGGADPDVSFGPKKDDSLLLRALHDPRRPVELLRCLADAGGRVARLFQGSHLHSVLQDAVLQQSLAAYPRQSGWDCYPAAVRHQKADAILQFLLAQAGPAAQGADARTRWLLDRWDPQWQRPFRGQAQQKKRPREGRRGPAKKRRSGESKDRREGAGRRRGAEGATAPKRFAAGGKADYVS